MGCNNQCEPQVTKKYIGSRYVPKLEGKWDINKEYENFSIVVDENNNSYTSKKIVPMGIPLSDTNFWVQTGNYEGILGEVDKKVNEHIIASGIKFGELNNDINTLKDNTNNAFQDLNKKVDDHILENKTEFQDITKALSDHVLSSDLKIEELGVKIDQNKTSIANLDAVIKLTVQDIENLKDGFQLFEIKQTEYNTLNDTNIKEINDKLTNHEDRIKNLETASTNHIDAITRIDKTLTDMNTLLTNIQNSITDIDNRVKKLENPTP